jgi:hypothetical protein
MTVDVHYLAAQYSGRDIDSQKILGSGRKRAVSERKQKSSIQVEGKSADETWIVTRSTPAILDASED